MNTYNDNLQSTVIETLAGINAQQQDMEAELTTAEYTLYHAQGTEITARDKLDATNELVTDWENINDQAIINDNQMYNLLTSSTDASKIVTTSVTNTATAASNVQIAANAISVLAADIGAALNVATASLFNTDVYSRIVQANSFINNVANDSRRIAKNAMNASASVSEVIAPEVLTLAKGCKTKVGNVLKSTQSELNMFSNLAITDAQTVSDSSKLERQAEGDVSDASRAVLAITQSYQRANQQLNMGLTIGVLSGFEITLAFQGLPDPLPTFTASPASVIPIPDANPSYYLTLVPEQNASTFSMDQATQLFQQAISPGEANSGFLSVSPASVSAAAASPVLLTVDAFGNSIVAGQSYVAYIFTELGLPYKQYINNFSDLLSAPSQAFTPATTLPGVQQITVIPGVDPDSAGMTWSTLQFQAVPLALSAEEAAQAAAADAEQANATAEAASQAAAATATAASNISSTASAAATADQTAQSAAATAASDAQAQATASAAAETAAEAALTANVMTTVTNAASVAASVASGAAVTANTAWQNVVNAQSAVTSAANSQGGTDGTSKGKGKAGSTSDSDAAQAKAQSAALALANATDTLLPSVAAAESAASWSATAANAAAVVVTLYDPTKAPACAPEVLNLAIAQAVANAADAAASAAASAAALAANDAASAAAASAGGSGSTSAANSAATTASSAAQASDAAAIAAVNTHAEVTAATENLNADQIEQANQVLIAAAGIVAASAGSPAQGTNTSGTTTGTSTTITSSISPALASAVVGAALSATSAAAAANNAVIVTNGVFGTTTQDTTTGRASSSQDANNTVQAAIAAVVTATQTVAGQTATNASSAATVSTSANQSATTATSNAATAASQAVASAATSVSAAQAAAAANDAAAAAMTQADIASKKSNNAAVLANSASLAAQASAALAAQIAAAGPVKPGTIMAAEAVAGAEYEYRCILVQAGGVPDLNFKLSAGNQFTPPIYFNLNLAEQISPANYVVAQKVSVQDSEVDAESKFSNPLWEVTFTSTVTDNFGNLLIPGVQYYPYMLTAATGDQTEQNQLVNVLSNNFGTYTICNTSTNT